MRQLRLITKHFLRQCNALSPEGCQSGGNILVSGAYVGSDMNGTQGNREFTQRVLKYGYQGSLTDKNSNRINGLGRTISIPRLPNENNYAIPAPDCIVPVDSAFPVFTYAPGNQSAGIAYKGNYRTFVLGFFESILSEADRAIVMAGILGFFTQKNKSSLQGNKKISLFIACFSF